VSAKTTAFNSTPSGTATWFDCPPVTSTAHKRPCSSAKKRQARCSGSSRPVLKTISKINLSPFVFGLGSAIRGTSDGSENWSLNELHPQSQSSVSCPAAKLWRSTSPNGIDGWEASRPTHSLAFAALFAMRSNVMLSGARLLAREVPTKKWTPASHDKWRSNSAGDWYPRAECSLW